MIAKKQIVSICFSKILIFSVILSLMCSTDSYSEDVGLAWYDNGTTISGATSCTVGGTFTPPTPPARTGYVFTGWHIKEIHSCAGQIQNLDTSIRGTTVGYSRLRNEAGSNESRYGLTRGSGLWAVEFSYGTVWGMADCNKIFSYNYNKPQSITQPTSTGQYCWCQVTGFTAAGNSYTSGPQCTTPVSNKWFPDAPQGAASSCEYFCPSVCADTLEGSSNARVAEYMYAGQ